MNMKRKTLLTVMSLVILAGFGLQGCSATSKGKTVSTAKSDTTRSIAAYFTPGTAKPKTPNAEGFIQRWLLLEPINKPNRSNTVFTDSYIRRAFDTLYFPNQFTVLPKDGEKIKVGQQELTWHALDSKDFNVKLFRFAYGLNKPIYGVLFWALTVVNSPQEMKNVRMAIGSNSA
ncbi:MAG: acetylxylan esterase, partial [Flavisolibacter sp.]|nr:acetylxylan esterase [Flavisolibacter sp.]